MTPAQLIAAVREALLAEGFFHGDTPLYRLMLGIVAALEEADRD